MTGRNYDLSNCQDLYILQYSTSNVASYEINNSLGNLHAPIE